MRIVIDADACPRDIKQFCEKLSIEHQFKLIMVCDNAHYLDYKCEIVTVEKGKDNVDFEIIKRSKKDDIVITQDYGLAAAILPKVYSVLNPKAYEYTKYNIDLLLMQRHMGQKLRKSGKNTKGPKKRKNDDKNNFENLLIQTIEKYKKENR